jgi:hypothetical protein
LFLDGSTNLSAIQKQINNLEIFLDDFLIRRHDNILLPILVFIGFSPDILIQNELSRFLRINHENDLLIFENLQQSTDEDIVKVSRSVQEAVDETVSMLKQKFHRKFGFTSKQWSIQPIDITADEKNLQHGYLTGFNWLFRYMMKHSFSNCENN